MANVHLVDELENAFQNCISALTNQEFLNVNDAEETKASTEQTILHFLDVAKQLETYFLQNRFLFSIHRPEQIIKEDIVELHSELKRKDALLSLHHEHLQQWQVLLSRAGGGGGSSGGQHPQTQQPASQTTTAQPQSAMPPPPQAQVNYPQGPLAFLEQTTSNIGMPERRT